MMMLHLALAFAVFLSPVESWATERWSRGSISSRSRREMALSSYDFRDSDELQRRRFLVEIATSSLITASRLPQSSLAIDDDDERPFHSAGYGREEYTNSIIASRDTNISPKEVYDTLQSDFLKEAYLAAKREKGSDYVPRALDVGAGAGVSTEVLYKLGFRNIEAVDWSGSAWSENVVDNPSGHCPSSVTFFELDDERYLDRWRETYKNRGDGLFDVITFNFAVNESKAKLFARELLNKKYGRLLAPVNTEQDFWQKQTYQELDSGGNVMWSAGDVGAWSVLFQPDVTQVGRCVPCPFDVSVIVTFCPNSKDTCSGVWCAQFNGFVKKK